MSPKLIILLVLAVLFLTPLSRVLIAALFGKSIGKAALAKQPDSIRLVPADPSHLRNSARMESVAAEYQRAGFENAGIFYIPELPAVYVQLLAHRRDSMAGAIYDHPVAGVFFDVISRYVGGASCTYTTGRDTGLKRRENARVVNRPGVAPSVLIELARQDRPQSGLRPCTPASVGPDFVAAYAEHIAWMKQRGISTAEVLKVATRKVA